MHAKYGPAVQVFSWFGKPFLIYIADPDLTEYFLMDNYTNRLPSFVSIIKFSIDIIFN